MCRMRSLWEALLRPANHLPQCKCILYMHLLCCVRSSVLVQAKIVLLGDSGVVRQHTWGGTFTVIISHIATIRCVQFVASRGCYPLLSNSMVGVKILESELMLVPCHLARVSPHWLCASARDASILTMRMGCETWQYPRPIEAIEVLLTSFDIFWHLLTVVKELWVSSSIISIATLSCFCWVENSWSEEISGKNSRRLIAYTLCFFWAQHFATGG